MESNHEPMAGVSLVYYYKASSLASWSFIGILIPILGIILGQSGMHYAELISTNDPAEVREVKQIYSKARTGRNLSIFLLLLSVVTIVLFVNVAVRFPANLNKELNQQVQQ